METPETGKLGRNQKMTLAAIWAPWSFATIMFALGNVDFPGWMQFMQWYMMPIVIGNSAVAGGVKGLQAHAEAKAGKAPQEC